MKVVGYFEPVNNNLIVKINNLRSDLTNASVFKIK